MAHYFPARILTGALILAVAGCDPSPAPREEARLASVDITAVESHIDAAQRKLAGDLMTAMAALTAATDQFLQNPSDASLLTARTAWHDAHRRFAALALLLGRREDNDEIDVWPIEPGFLDTLPGYPASGIVGDEVITISLATLRAQHGITHPSEASLGFHPAEYFLFERALSDFEDTAENPRRRQTLELIVRHLEASVQAFVEREAATSGGSKGERLEAILARHRVALQTAVAEIGRHGDGADIHPGFSSQAPGVIELLWTTLGDLYAQEEPLGAAITAIDPAIATEIRRNLEHGADERIQGVFTLPLNMTTLGDQLRMIELRL